VQKVIDVLHPALVSTLWLRLRLSARRLPSVGGFSACQPGLAQAEMLKC
jgi:hypothetical protein